MTVKKRDKLLQLNNSVASLVFRRDSKIKTANMCTTGKSKRETITLKVVPGSIKCLFESRFARQTSV